MSYMNDWEGRETGYKRKKLAGYLKAANELRQSYQSNAKQSLANRGYQADGGDDMPGSYPGASMTRNGDEQLVLFPSYARRHERRRQDVFPGAFHGQQRSYGQNGQSANGIDESEFWRQEHESSADDKAIVDVDVRGWIYAPQRGPPNRKNRIMLGLARQLSGIPAPRNGAASVPDSREDSPAGLRQRIDANGSRQEEELALREAEYIVSRGEAEANVATAGGYSERPSRARNDPGDDLNPSSRTASPDRFRDEFAKKRRNQVWSDEGGRRRSQALDPAQMSQAELSVANSRLMDRLAPLMGNPLANTNISAFFYNDDDSKMKNLETDATGHFTVRMPLDFIPTHVRVLASEKLSASTAVRITDPHGVSVISDIDDTIKHSAISSGAKEIFRNVFIRDFGELSIEGVRDWYNTLADMGCEFHYVSNSPWQLYPALSGFFKSAGLPLGSFHLKQYNGMLQGIFEPVAERKKAALDRLMRDFPERRFILIGDSGEADLEVYTDAVVEYPNRVLGVFIRDVTTSRRQSFFDPALGPLSNERLDNPPPPQLRAKPQQTSRIPARQGTLTKKENADLEEAIARSLADVGTPPEALQRSLSRHSRHNSRNSPIRPPLPPRRPTAPAAPEENLIDLASDDERPSGSHQKGEESPLPKDWLRPPPPPMKPRSLSSSRIQRTPSNEGPATNSAGKPTPPRPRKPSTSVHVQPNIAKQEEAPPLPSNERISIPQKIDEDRSTKPQRPAPPPARRTYARQKLTDAYNRMPSPKSMVFGSRPSTPRSSPTHSRSSSIDPDMLSGPTGKLSMIDYDGEGRKPPMPPRKPTLQSINFDDMVDEEHLAYGDDHAGRYGSVSGAYNSYGQQPTALSKKEEAWRRRWARAKEILDARGIMLRSWRVGEEVQADAVALVEGALKENTRGRRR